MDEPSARGSSVQLFYPQFGVLEGAFGFGLFYELVGRVTRVVTTDLAGAYQGLVPEPFTTAMAGLLWLALATTVGVPLLRQVTANPLTFRSVTARDDYLERHRPTGARYLLALAQFVVGGAVVALGWQYFLALFDSWMAVFLRGGFPRAVGAVELLWFVGFVLGYSLFARGLDRLVVGGWRDLLYRRRSTGRSSSDARPTDQ